MLYKSDFIIIKLKMPEIMRGIKYKKLREKRKDGERERDGNV